MYIEYSINSLLNSVGCFYEMKYMYYTLLIVLEMFVSALVYLYVTNLDIGKYRICARYPLPFNGVKYWFVLYEILVFQMH